MQYYCGDYHRIPLEDATVDGVFYLESLCHSTRPDEALAEAARILKPGGRIVMTDGYLLKPLEKSSAVCVCVCVRVCVCVPQVLYRPYYPQRAERKGS